MADVKVKPPTCLIHRTCARYQEISDKESFLILAAADGSRKAMDRTLEGFRTFTSCLDGAQEKGVIHGAGAWEVGDIEGSPAMKAAYEPPSGRICTSGRFRTLPEKSGDFLGGIGLYQTKLCFAYGFNSQRRV